LTSLLTGCATSDVVQPDNKFAKNFQAPDRSKRIVLLPSKVDSPQFASGGSVVNRQLYAQLQRANYKVAVLDEKNYVETWGQEVAAVGGIYDPQSGRFRPDAYARALSSLVKRITAEVDCSMVLAPRFVLQTAKVSHSSASWDGVTRAEHEKDEVLMSNLKYEYDGTAAGLSLELMAFNDKGEWEFTTYGGILLPYQSDVKKKKGVLRSDLFSDPKEIREATDLVLSPLQSVKQ